jgi:general secretion pathway protein K
VNARQNGMALVVVLWIIVLLSIMAAGHTRGTHVDTQLASRQVSVAQARGYAEAGINHTLLMLLSDKGRDVPVDGRIFGVAVDDTIVTLAVRSATGLVDLNAAPADLLDAALTAAGIADTQRRSVVDAILDWRDGDDLRHLDGVEDQDYIAAGLPWTSRDGAIAAVDELRYVPGIGQNEFERLAPLVTVYSESSGVDIELAPPILVEAMTGERIEPASHDEYSGGNAGRGPQSGTFHIYATVEAGSGAVAAIEAVVTTSRSSDAPVIVHEWREPPRQVVPPLEGADG